MQTQAKIVAFAALAGQSQSGKVISRSCRRRKNGFQTLEYQLSSLFDSPCFFAAECF
jgi:hypothetical protein